MNIFAHDSWVMGIDGWKRRGKLRQTFLTGMFVAIGAMSAKRTPKPTSNRSRMAVAC